MAFRCDKGQKCWNVGKEFIWRFIELATGFERGNSAKEAKISKNLQEQVNNEDWVSPASKC